MHIFRIYTPQILNLNKIIILSDQSTHYLKNVLRITIKNLIILFNNENQEFLGKIIKFYNNMTYIFLIKKLCNNTESPLKIHLGQVICNRKSMEYIIQKSVELGVFQITPLLSEYCYKKIKFSQLKIKIERWKKMIIFASQQCGRKYLLQINQPLSIIEWCEKKNDILKIYTDPKAKNRINDIYGHHSKIRLLIGPEGGLSKKEQEYIIKNNFYTIKIGPRILRVETSALCAITLLQTFFGDF
ncbi:MAG: 16S rRNA (uracil(1498)-N(3))-methyltransferase [Wigglesworthia glossinidia]|nr:16S rRNA (uracil(1498)-N(3))-methyltransferase [Wigglesworthia glossinidia]